MKAEVYHHKETHQEVWRLLKDWTNYHHFFFNKFFLLFHQVYWLKRMTKKVQDWVNMISKFFQDSDEKFSASYFHLLV
jgi:hypothetical protein